jgi:penicillin amidase
MALPAVQLIPLLNSLESNKSDVLWAIQELMAWDKQMTPNSIGATIYYAWETKLKEGLWELSVPGEVKEYITTVSLKRVVEWLLFPDDRFGSDPIAGRDAFALDALEKGLDWIKGKLGRDKTKWHYGQTNMKHSKLTHALSAMTPDSIDQMLNIGPLPRGGYGYTVGSTGNGLIQRSGATFKVIIDTGDWDKSAAMNSPGQSGDPENKHYKDLFEHWAKDKYFPLFYSKEKVKAVQDYQYLLTPQ